VYLKQIIFETLIQKGFQKIKILKFIRFFSSQNLYYIRGSRIVLKPFKNLEGFYFLVDYSFCPNRIRFSIFFPVQKISFIRYGKKMIFFGNQ